MGERGRIERESAERLSGRDIESGREREGGEEVGSKVLLPTFINIY